MNYEKLLKRLEDENEKEEKDVYKLYIRLIKQKKLTIERFENLMNNKIIDANPNDFLNLNYNIYKIDYDHYYRDMKMIITYLEAVKDYATIFREDREYMVAKIDRVILELDSLRILLI